MTKEYERWTEWVCKCGNSMKHRCPSGVDEYKRGYDDAIGGKTKNPLERLPPRPWVNLTNEEIGEIYRVGWANNMELARAIEAKLKEKNYEST